MEQTKKPKITARGLTSTILILAGLVVAGPVLAAAPALDPVWAEKADVVVRGEVDQLEEITQGELPNGASFTALVQVRLDEVCRGELPATTVILQFVPPVPGDARRPVQFYSTFGWTEDGPGGEQATWGVELQPGQAGRFYLEINREGDRVRDRLLHFQPLEAEAERAPAAPPAKALAPGARQPAAGPADAVIDRYLAPVPAGRPAPARARELERLARQLEESAARSREIQARFAAGTDRPEDGASLQRADREYGEAWQALLAAGTEALPALRRAAGDGGDSHPLLVLREIEQAARQSLVEELAAQGEAAEQAVAARLEAAQARAAAAAPEERAAAQERCRLLYRLGVQLRNRLHPPDPEEYID